MKVTPPHTRLAPWRRIAGITNPDTSLPPGVDPSPEDPDDPPIDRGADEQGAAVVSLSDVGPVSLVQSVAHGGGGDLLLVTAAFDAQPTAGNVLILILGGRSDPNTINVPDGFTSLEYNTFAGVESYAHRMVAKVSDGTETTITFDNTGNGGPETVILSEWTGFGGVLPTADASATADVTDDSTPAVPAITPTAAISALLIASVWKKTAGPNPGPSTLSGYTVLDDSGFVGTGNRHRLTAWYQVVDPTAGTYGPTDVSNTGDGTDDSNIIHIALETTPDEAAWVVPEPFVNDGDDATYGTVDGTELLRMDLGAPFDIRRTRIHIATTTAGARTLTIKGANAPDFSDEVTLTTIDFTATGGLTAQSVTGEWSPPEDYRYFQLDIGTSDTYRIHTWEMFEDPPPEAVDDHGELSGLGDDDHPQYLRVRDGGGDQVSTVGAAGATETIDLANGNVHNITLDDDCTFTFSGAAAGRARSFRLYLWQDGTGGHVVTWPGSVEWAGGAPTIDTDPDTLSVFMFETLDGGTIWHGYPVGGATGGSSSLTIEDEGTPLATAATTLDFVGAGVTATGAGASKTITIPGGLDLGWYNVEDYGAVHDGTTDDTSAIQDAIDACFAAGGGTIWFPEPAAGDFYAVNGALVSTGTFNSQLTIPQSSSGLIYLRFLGSGSTVGRSTLRSNWNGVISGSPAIISAGLQDSVTLNQVYVVFEHLRIEAPTNPKLTAVQVTKAATVRWYDFALATSTDTVIVPTNANAIGLDLPYGLNDQNSGGTDVNIGGYYTGIRPSEQMVADAIYLQYNANGLEMRGSEGPSDYLCHAVQIQRLNFWHNANNLVATGGDRWIYVSAMDCEKDCPTPFTPTYDIDDPNDYLHGFIAWHTTDHDSGFATDDLDMNGGANLSLHGGEAKRWRLTDVVEMPERTDPSAAATGTRRIYAKTDGFYEIDDTGAVSALGGGAPSGPAGGDLSGTYPNPSVVDNSHNHDASTAPGGAAGGAILLESGHAVPFTFDEILQESDGSDFLHASA